MGIEAGKLRHRITIQSKCEMKDELGTTIHIWVDKYKNIAASFEFLSAKEFVASQSYQANVVARVVIRWRGGLDSTMRILYKDKIYNITGLLPDLDSGIEYITIPVTSELNND